MVDLQTYRARIGLFNLRSPCGTTRKVKKPSQDQLAIGLALIITLLIIGGIEPNPGPMPGSMCEEQACEPGPSFVDVSLPDLMEAIRITQMKLDKVARDVSHLASSVQEIARTSHQMTDVGHRETVHYQRKASTNIQKTEIGHSTVSISGDHLESHPAPYEVSYKTN